MAEYWKTRPSVIQGDNELAQNGKTGLGVTRTLSDYDKYRETLLSNDAEEGWASELRRYLSMMQRDVMRETDVVEWWQASTVVAIQSLFASDSILRITPISIQHSRVLPSIYFLPKRHPFLVNGCSQERSKLPLTVELV
jgi:hypothetical protein